MNNNNKRNSNRENYRAATKEEAMLAEQRRIERIRKNKARRKALEKITAIMFFSIIGAAISLGIVFGFIFFDYRTTEKAVSADVLVTIGDEKAVTLNEKHFFFRDGECFVSLTKISDMCAFTLHGDVKSMTLSVSENIYASFTVGSPVVEIAGTNNIMSGKAYFEHEQLFVPFEFFKNYCNGVTAEYKGNGKNKGYNLIFDGNFSLLAKTPIDISPNPKTVPRELVEVKPQFKADLSSYEMYMNPQKRNEYLTLINTENMLSSDYVPDDLVEIADTRKDGRAKQKMRLYAAKSLEALFIEMRANGFSNVSVTSGYRSYDYQSKLLQNEIALLRPSYGDKAEQQAKKQVAVPGSSEHQSGLCIDMHNLPSASVAFANQDVYKWLYSNCANFGFILRFPKDKTDITNIIFEPWHYRYVGRYHAQKIMEQGLCLEEYIASLS